MEGINNSPYFEMTKSKDTNDLKIDPKILKESPRSTTGFEGHCAAPMNKDNSDILDLEK